MERVGGRLLRSRPRRTVVDAFRPMETRSGRIAPSFPSSRAICSSCRHRRRRVPLSPRSPVTRDPPGGTEAVVRLGEIYYEPNDIYLSAPGCYSLFYVAGRGKKPSTWGYGSTARSCVGKRPRSTGSNSLVRVAVSTRAPGIIRAVYVRRGQQVKRGQKLLLLVDSPQVDDAHGATLALFNPA
jgi:hypothetical protein